MKAFTEEIVEKGMKFTMDDLARRLGISKRTLYEHFSSKAEVLDTIIDHALQESNLRSKQIIEDNSLSILDKIKAIITVMPDYVELVDHRILEQMKRVFPDQWSRLDGLLKDDWDVLRELLEQGMEQGLIQKRNSAFLVKLITDALNSTLDQRFFAKQNISLQDAVNSIADVILFGLVPRTDHES
ncbi:TetR/AcrR family transcriptional regulator [Paenibacillus marinisediminis]